MEAALGDGFETWVRASREMVSSVARWGPVGCVRAGPVPRVGVEELHRTWGVINLWVGKATHVGRRSTHAPCRSLRCRTDETWMTRYD